MMHKGITDRYKIIKTIYYMGMIYLTYEALEFEAISFNFFIVQDEVEID